jgi:DNA-binding SARP family transcriptional activator
MAAMHHSKVAATLSVRMLGGLAFVSGGCRVGADLGANGRLLAAYLLEFPSRIHRRERLASLFWADKEPGHARATLNTALWRVRKLLARGPNQSGPVLHTGGQEIVIELATRIHIDTHHFDSAARSALGDMNAPSPGTLALEAAVGSYFGSFLDGTDSDWIIAERERLHTLYVRCLSELMKTHAASCQYELAISAARRILNVDPFRESVQRQLVLLLTLNGQRAQAIVELRRWAVDLRREMGIEPMPETGRLERSILSGEICSGLSELKRSYFPAAAAQHGPGAR